MSSDSEDHDSVEGSNAGMLTAEEGLSSSTLAALLEFLDPSIERSEPIIDSSVICTAYTERDMDVIAQTMSRLQEKSDASERLLKQRVIQNLDAPISSNILTELVSKGVVRINKVLTTELCNRCLADINEQLLDCCARGISEYSEDKETGFGNVYSRLHRWDMYQHNSGVIAESLSHMLKPESELRIILDEVFLNEDAQLHELSALISDSGASSQPIHPDSKYQMNCPLYTIFIALQDVTETMGPTVFLPGTHTLAAHNAIQSSSKAEFLASCEYRQALLNKGDAVILDSRTLHFGNANSSVEDLRRVLLYFTLRSPQFWKQEDLNVYFEDGSKFEALKISLHNF